ncbi:hypothetical protein GCM10009868_34390 [Terrabacter aerolatus]|uniref:Uncharacterized protein n=1 Tax=Terrabacter aerolatus TaxID=422442 RepID=A0A512CWJ8_9MICO|nr:hypothetical protein [Terrabacter aerolatus]GEO28576.1 hypothetical protein TAE01_03860 [Terrabacter aerolatus]
MAVNGTPRETGEAAETPTPDELRRAERLLREGAETMRSEAAPGWFDVAQRVTGAVRSAARRSIEIDAAWPEPTHGSATGDRLRVSDLVVVDALRRALVSVPQCQPSAVDLVVEEEPSGAVRCRGARVGLVAAFDVDLHAAADRARRLTLDTLSDVLGPPPDGVSREAVVDVEIVDVTPHDPRR